VLLNLIVNAIDATEHIAPGTRNIDISTAATPAGGVKVTVADNGIGLDGVDLRRLFTLSYTTKPSGTGIGLSVCQGIVSAHHGEITVASRPGGGTLFTIGLPASAAPPAAPGAAELPREIRGRILVVEDEPEIAQMVEEVLRRDGHEILLASSGREALARLEAAALQNACCRLLMELARLESAGAGRKREVVVRAMKGLFAVEDENLAPMLDAAGDGKNRLTSYFKPVALINKRFSAPQKAQFVEWLWRVALADGKIDMYEDHLVRKFADLLYVPHIDFIMAKHRAQGQEGPPVA